MKSTAAFVLAAWAVGLGSFGAAEARGGERISLRLGVSSYSPKGGDLAAWIDSYNALWTDWRAARGGALEGAFAPLDFGPGLAGDLRIRIVSGLGFVIGGTRLRSEAAGSVAYRAADGTQTETHALTNRVSALPLKIGLDFRYPILDRLEAVVGAGRHIIFVKYDVRERYEARFTSFGEDFAYWFERDDDFRSEALGTYVVFGLEYSVLDMLAVVLTGEQVWSEVDGFKGAHSYRAFDREEEGQASLYYYESDLFGLSKAYPVLTGHRERPEDPALLEVRQGRLDFGGFAVQLGLRLKF